MKEKRNTFQGGYGKLVTKGEEYSYDLEGNLTRKTEANGDIWEYSYYGNGLLRKVVRLTKVQLSLNTMLLEDVLRSV